MSASKARPLGYVTASRRRSEDSGFERVAIFRCVECPAINERVIKPNQPANPEEISKWAINAGWLAHPWEQSRVLCPACLAAKRSKPRKETTMEAKPTPINGGSSVVAIKTPTQDHRLKIRSLLDANFDDAVGCYLAGWDDERIARECSVAPAVVERIREAAYGPIRTDPEVLALRHEIDALQKEYIAMADKLNALALRCQGLEGRRTK